MAHAGTNENGPTRRFYDRISRVYDLIADQSEHASREEGVALLAPSPGDVVLEIGFGTGHALLDLAKATGPSGRVLGVELSFGMLQVARHRLQENLAQGTVLPFHGDARHLPIAAGSLDAAFSSFTLELFSDQDMRRVLGELKRVLRGSARLGLVSMAEPDTRNLEVELYRWLHRHFPHIIDCRPIDGAQVLSENGFDVVEQGRRSIWGLPVDILVGRLR